MVEIGVGRLSQNPKPRGSPDPVPGQDRRKCLRLGRRQQKAQQSMVEEGKERAPKGAKKAKGWALEIIS